MLNTSTRKRVGFGLAAAAIGATLIAGSPTSPASADPTQLTALVGMGSDTTQDVMNAMAGFNFGLSYTPVNSGAATNYKHIISFDASPAQSASDTCVAPIVNGPTFTRPNGSGSGRKSLYAASGLSAAGWTGSSFTKDDGTVVPVCATTVNIGGMINFARTSSVSSNAGSDVTYIPFGRDATLLTIPDPDGTGTLTVVPCGIQTGSGTHQFFRDTVVLSNVANEALAVNTCTPTATSRLQESKGDLLKIKGDALDATLDDFVVIVGYSAAAYIAQANLVSAPNGFNQIQIGSISDDSPTGGGTNLGAPYLGTAPNLTPNPTFYASTGVGRDVYNLFRRSLIVNTGTGVLLNNAYTALFAGPTSKVCMNSAVTNTFGFASIANCGAYNVTNRAWDTGVS